MLSQTTHAAALPLLPYEVLSQPQRERRPHLGATRCFARNAEIFGEDEAATHIYRVVSGAVRAYRILHDGRRQIIAFYLPGDLFGFEAGSHHLNSAEAICESQISAIRLNAASRPMAGSADPTSDLWSMVKEELRRMQDHMVLLVRSAEERVAHFLLEMSRRSGNLATVNLQMSRQDIADYLGITIETVSRTLTHFEQAGFISLRTSRQIDLCRRSALARLNA
jgi:CRP/FNR family nitrogen fixation transcriptional regulator